MTISPDTRYKGSSSAIACDLGDGLALLETSANRYYNLNAVGAFIWGELATAKSPRELSQLVSERYGVDSETSLHDVLALVIDLVAERLLQSVDDEDRVGAASASS